MQKLLKNHVVLCASSDLLYKCKILGIAILGMAVFRNNGSKEWLFFNDGGVYDDVI